MILSRCGITSAPKEARKRLADRFKDPADDFRLAIVCDMWLTGFDVPCAHTMYIDKPLAGHNLMQAIARVNRVYGEKPGGLIVDLLGLADQLADALATYAQAGGTGEAVKVECRTRPCRRCGGVREAASVLSRLRLRRRAGADPQWVLRVYLQADRSRLRAERGGDWLEATADNGEELSAAFALAVPRPETEPVVDHLAFYQRVAAMIRKRLADESDGGGRAAQARHRRGRAAGHRRRRGCGRGHRSVRCCRA